MREQGPQKGIKVRGRQQPEESYPLPRQWHPFSQAYHRLVNHRARIEYMEWWGEFSLVRDWTEEEVLHYTSSCLDTLLFGLSLSEPI